jgi:hypothetical protein
MARNPWTVKQRTVIAKIVNLALNLELKYEDIVGCVTQDGQCAVYWKAEGDRCFFWFDLMQMREWVRLFTIEYDLHRACVAQNCQMSPAPNGWHITSLVGGRYLGLARLESLEKCAAKDVLTNLWLNSAGKVA